MAITTFDLPTIDALTDQYCRDVRVMRYSRGVANPNVSKGSEVEIRGRAIASFVFQIMAREQAKEDATMPDAAVGDDLQRLCDIYGVATSLGAGANGNIIAECTGTVTYVVGLELTSSDGLRYEVTSTTIATSGTRIPIRGVDTGKRTEKSAGTTLTWTSPPSGSNTTCLVDEIGLHDGMDADNDERKRARLLDALSHPRNSGAWGHYREWTTNASSAVEAAFVYPAVQGPGTVQVAITVAPTAAYYYSREASDSLLAYVGNRVVEEHPEHADLSMTTVNDSEQNLILQVTCPDHVIDGGPGGTWIDQESAVWPIYYSTATALTAAPTVPTVISVNCNHSSNAPKAGSYFAIWSKAQKRFIRARVKSATLTSGTTYAVTLYAPIDIAALASGDWLSPDMEKLDDYGIAVAESFGGLGPSELVSDGDLLPRALRRPFPMEAWPMDYTSSHVGQLSERHPELYHVKVTYPASMPITVTMPETSPPKPPNILILGKLAIYPPT